MLQLQKEIIAKEFFIDKKTTLKIMNMQEKHKNKKIIPTVEGQAKVNQAKH